MSVLDRQNAWLAGLSEEDRLALQRGEGMPSRRRRTRRIVRGLSNEAQALFTLLERAGGERSVASFKDTSMSGFVLEAAAELRDMGLAEVVGGRSRVRVTSAAAMTVVIASWSRREGTGERPGVNC